MNLESFADKPKEVRQSIKEDNKAALSAMGKAGAKKRTENIQKKETEKEAFEIRRQEHEIADEKALRESTNEDIAPLN